MIKIKLSALIEAFQALKRIGACKIDALAAYKVSLVITKAREPLVTYDETRQRLLTELGKSEDGGANFTVPPESVAKLNEQMKALLDAEVEIAIEPIPMSRFAGRELSPDDLALASAFFSDEAGAAERPRVRRK
jgi:hypothetical protein